MQAIATIETDSFETKPCQLGSSASTDNLILSTILIISTLVCCSYMRVLFLGLNNSLSSAGGGGSSVMEGAKAGLPKPELVHKLEGCTDEVT